MHVDQPELAVRVFGLKNSLKWSAQAAIPVAVIERAKPKALLVKPVSRATACIDIGDAGAAAR
jgi:hypothetical protein